MLDTLDTLKKCAVNMLMDMKKSSTEPEALLLNKSDRFKKDHHLIRLMTGKRNVDAMRV